MNLKNKLIHVYSKNQFLKRAFSICQIWNTKIVKIPVQQGIVVGQHQTLPSGVQYESFLGIPYAKPPVGKLRYQSPVPLERFNVPELDCSNHRDVPYQKDIFSQKMIGSENCLFLNIYVPKTKRREPLPVMVWIFGGGFRLGHGNNDYHFPEKLMEEDVIVVTLNYRLGALGFLYLPEAGIHGNAGLKDQRLALQWVQDNISNFNGDPNNVTLFGQSAGGASIHLHAYAQHANKLFHKIIMQSGTANMEWVFQINPERKTRRLAELLGFQSTNKCANELLQFLQSDKITLFDIYANTIPVLTKKERRRELHLVFKPIVEHASSPDSFINIPILELLQKKAQLQTLPTIMGYNSAEGISLLTKARKKYNDYDQDLERMLPRDLISDLEDPIAHEAAAQIRDFYFKGQRITKELFNQFVDLFTDYHFNIDMQHAAELHARYQPEAPFYFYRFDYIGKRNIFKKILYPGDINGACHGDELFYLFQMAGNKEPVTKEDAQMTKRLCQFWANFAHYGNPSTADIKWTPVKKLAIDDENFILDYLVIDKHCEMRQNPDGERIQFWRNMYNKYGSNPVKPRVSV